MVRRPRHPRDQHAKSTLREERASGRHLLVVEDNLTKGASGQAVQCMNLMCGLDEHLGLTGVPVLP